MSILRATILLALFAPLLSSAAVGANAIKTWNTPAPGAVYAYTDPVVFQGTVEVPEDWFGRIRVFQDDIHLPQFDQTFSNFDQLATIYPFQVDTGAWPSGMREAEVRFDGADECRLVCSEGDSQCIADSQNDSNVEDWCARSVDNQSVDQIYPSRTITIGPLPVPVMEVSPDPINFWSHIQGSAEVTMNISIINNGGSGTLVGGTVTRTTPGTEFYCKSNCTYSILPTDPPHIVTVAFIPPATVGSFSGVFQFSCPACPGGNISIPVAGQTSAVPSAAVISTDRMTLDFGSIPLGSWDEEDIYIENTGGTPMIGSIQLPPGGQFRCSGTCNFSLDPSEGTTRTIVYEPTYAAPPPADAVAVIQAAGATSVGISLVASGNDIPQLEVWTNSWVPVNNGGTIQVDNLMTVNVGVPETLTFYLYNVGGGLLDADVVGLPSADGVFTCANLEGRSPDDCALVTGIDYYQLDLDGDGNYDDEHAVVSITILANDTSLHSVTVQARNKSLGSTQPPITATLLVQANDAPISRVGPGGYGCLFRFGNILVGQSALPQPYGYPVYSVENCTIENVGAGTLNVNLPTSFARSGPGRWSSYGSGLFECVTGPGLSCGAFTLGPSQAATFQYRFTATEHSIHDFYPADPVDGGPRGFLGFSSGDLHFHAGGVLLQATTTAYYSSKPLPYDFGAVNLGASSQVAPFSISVQRKGGKFQESFSTSISGATMNYQTQDPPHFKCVFGCGGMLNPNGIATNSLQFVFRPGATSGTATEIFPITYDFGSWVSPEGNPAISLPFTGFGNDQPVLQVSGDYVPPVVDFGTVNVGNSGQKQITLTNIGLGTLSGDFGAFTAPFSCAYGWCGHFDLPANTGTNITFQFDPLNDIFYEDFVSLTTNGGNRTFTLRGFGRKEPELTVIPLYIHFDLEPDGSTVYTPVGEVKSKTFRVENTGLGTMVGDVSFQSPTPHFFLPPQNFALAPGEWQDITVQFSPILDGVPLNATVIVSASDSVSGWSDERFVALMGTGEFASLLDFRGPLPNYGPVVFGRSKELGITIANLGARPLGQGIFSFPPGSPFTCLSPIGPSGECEYDVGPYGDATFVVRFTPQGLGAVTSGGMFSTLPGYDIDFTGTGVPPQFKYLEQ